MGESGEHGGEAGHQSIDVRRRPTCQRFRDKHMCILQLHLKHIKTATHEWECKNNLWILTFSSRNTPYLLNLPRATKFQLWAIFLYFLLTWKSTSIRWNFCWTIIYLTGLLEPGNWVVPEINHEKCIENMFARNKYFLCNQIWDGKWKLQKNRGALLC